MNVLRRLTAPPGEPAPPSLASLIGVLSEQDALQLAHRVSRAARRDGRLVQLIGPQGGEGTSSLARDLALTLSARSHAPVLLLDLDLPANGQLAWFQARGMATRLLRSEAPDEDVPVPRSEAAGPVAAAPGAPASAGPRMPGEAIGEGPPMSGIDMGMTSGTLRLHEVVGTWLVVSEQVLRPGQASIHPELLARGGVLERLRAAFAQVVVDSPPLGKSFEGVALSADMDATVVVLRAERTRAPVARDICERLTESGAQLAGFVFNRRRRLIPSFLYRRIW